MIGSIDSSTPKSAYNPTKDIKDLTATCQRDYLYGVEILDKSYLELNDRSVLDDQNVGQMMFNAFVDTSVEDPREAWKWRGTRSKARNKAIAMHANLAANILLPMYSAQNDGDDIDREFSEGMRDIIEWMASPDVSNYQSSFLQGVMGMLTNPVTYLGAEYCEVFQTIKELKADGSYEKKEIMDQVLSGFQVPIYSASEVLITNAYERNLQKQRTIIKRRYVEKSELEAKYGEHPYWGYVQEGVKSIYSDEDQLFYDVRDEDHPYLVAEETVLNRRGDLEVCFVNGIYMGDVKDVDANPIYHRDNHNAPKYNVVPFGYSRIGEHFFYYKSLMSQSKWDNDLYDAMSEIVMNRALLEVDSPIAVTGTDEIDSGVIFPNSVVSVEAVDAKITKLLPETNLAAGFNALRETEKSIDEGTVSATMSGQLPDKEQKAFSVAQAQANSKRLVGAAAKSLAESVCLLGDLMKDIAINQLTVPEVEELLGGRTKLKYKSFVLSGKISKSKRMSRKVLFDKSFINMDVSDEEKTEMEMEHLEEIGYPHNKETLSKLNPALFASYRYLTRVDPEEVFIKNAEYWQPVLINLLSVLAQNPFVDYEALTRETMHTFFQSRGEDFVKQSQPNSGLMPNLGQDQLSLGGSKSTELSPKTPSIPVS